MLDRLKQRARALGERHPVLQTAWRVQQRVGEVQGSRLAAAISLSAFLSLFPLLLVAMAVLGFVSAGDPDLPSNTLDFLGLDASDDAASVVLDTIDTAEESRAAASVVGLLGLAWTGLGLVGAIQYALNAVWQVVGRGFKGKLVAVGWLAGAALLFLASVVVTSLINALPGYLAPINLAVGLGLSFALFLWTMKVLAHRDIGWKALVPGAAFGAIGLEVLKVVASVYVPRLVASSSATYGSIGVVFAILAWLMLFGRLIVYASVVNVVRWEEEHGTAVIDVRVPNLSPVEPDAHDRAGHDDAEPATERA